MAPIQNQDGECSRTARNRRVRLSYPAALVELALVLCGTVGTRKAASALGVGMSTVYRWMDLHRTAWMPRNFLRTDGQPAQIADVVVALSTRCERAGFRVRSPRPNRDGVPAPERETRADDFANRKFAESAETHRILALGRIAANEVDATEEMIRAKREIEHNFATRLSCRSLADFVDMPRFTFIRKFTAAFGVPPYQYLLCVRVRRAWEMLQRSSAPLPAVAAATGFGSATSMTHAFKRFAGASPAKVVNMVAPMRTLAPVNSQDAQMLCEREVVNA
jgi:AraC-like DNA-binding protein